MVAITTRNAIFLLLCCFPPPASRVQYYRLPHAYDIFEFLLLSLFQFLAGNPLLPHGLLFSCFSVAFCLGISREMVAITTRSSIFLLLCCFPPPASRVQHYRLPHTYDIFEFFIAFSLPISCGDPVIYTILILAPLICVISRI